VHRTPFETNVLLLNGAVGRLNLGFNRIASFKVKPFFKRLKRLEQTVIKPLSILRLGFAKVGSENLGLQPDAIEAIAPGLSGL
jgi:hypothetical protein